MLCSFGNGIKTTTKIEYSPPRLNSTFDDLAYDLFIQKTYKDSVYYLTNPNNSYPVRAYTT